MAKRKKRARKRPSKTTIKRGTCRVIKGAVRVCMSKGGLLRVTPTGLGGSKRRRKSAGKKGKKLAKPKMCSSKPTLRKGRCTCKLKSGKKKVLRIAYCRAPKR